VTGYQAGKMLDSLYELNFLTSRPVAYAKFLEYFTSSNFASLFRIPHQDNNV
jgi:hypothetical protein